MKKELNKIAIDEDTSLSDLILKMIEETMENRKNRIDNMSDLSKTTFKIQFT